MSRVYIYIGNRIPVADEAEKSRGWIGCACERDVVGWLRGGRFEV